MPYIEESPRLALQSGELPANAGELNYCITILVKQYVERMGNNYAAINAAVGALECAKLELYRRVAVPYEDQKIKENGDVY